MKRTPYLRFLKRALGTTLCLAALTAVLSAKPVPENLGYGLDKLVESNLTVQAAAKEGPDALAKATQFDGYATEQAADYAANAITDPATGRVTVDIVLGGSVSFKQVRAELQRTIPSLTIKAVDVNYRSTGIIEGYISVDDVPAAAKIAGVRSVFLALKPTLDSTTPEDMTVYSPSRTVPSLKALTQTKLAPSPEVVPNQVLNKLGTTFDQGVTQHRVDKINRFYNPTAQFNYDGAGISIGAMSDSYNTRAAAPHADTGIANFDLPGAANNPVNTQPVVVLVDDPAAGTDEGRGMIEIIYKMAPRARLAFANGVEGEVAFGNYIRALAGVAGFTFPPAVQQGFKADVICDDISYGGEPFYGESIIGGAIDEVAALGVSYFSSAGNNVGINAYESALRVIPNGNGVTAGTNAALVGTNIDLTGVPTNLYQGGFHNFSPNGGQDVAQLWNMPTAAQSTEMQWDDPYDIREPVLNQPAIYQNTGTIDTAGTPVVFTNIPPFTQGTGYVINVAATSGDLDVIVDLIDQNGTTVVSQDTGTDEVVTFYAPTSGQYSIRITRFASTSGNFTIKINTTNSPGAVTTDFNLLVFRADTGAYIAARSLTTNNIANNRPVELGSVASPTGQTQVQFVIARSSVPNVPPGTQLPTRVRISIRGNGAGGIGPAEYFTYNATTTKGHATAAGGNGVAAYSPFRPNIPEAFTSPGPATILFDKNANRLAAPIIRLQPTIAAIDGANTSFFGGDSANDPDTNPNFSGTSAAAPHAAALAGLVLQAHGGSGTVNANQMRSILQRSAFPHDLDPSYASGVARSNTGGKLTITVSSDNDANTATGQNDPNSIVVSYVGPGAIQSLAFNPNGTNTEGGNVTGGNNGYLENPGSTPTTVTYFANYFPGLAFLPATKAFTLGTLTGLNASDVIAPQSTTPYSGFSNLSPVPGNGTSQFRTMTIGFTPGVFTGGKVLRFTVGRGAEHSANTGNGLTVIGPGTVTSNPIADVFGGGVFIPEGTVVQAGMRFRATLTDGSTFEGTLQNRIGSGYTPVDGYGVINAESAVTLPIQ
ncbi:MAG: S8 family serine peptidase [Verrucomicrobiota bacterium]|nr:S8 family serine peptidase [Verrucomicrobiota bacterium]